MLIPIQQSSVQGDHSVPNVKLVSKKMNIWLQDNNDLESDP